MRGAVLAWLTQLAVYAALERSAAAALLFVLALPTAAWALHSAISMGRDATIACAVMAMGASVWHVERDAPLWFAVLLSWAFLMPLVCRSVVVR